MLPRATSAPRCGPAAAHAWTASLAPRRRSAAAPARPRRPLLHSTTLTRRLPLLVCVGAQQPQCATQLSVRVRQYPPPPPLPPGLQRASSAAAVASHALFAIFNPRMVVGWAGYALAPVAHVDLHGQQGAEAVALLESVVLPYAAANGIGTLTVITGVGRHSSSGHATMRTAVAGALERWAAAGRFGVLRASRLDSDAGFEVRLR